MFSKKKKDKNDPNEKLDGSRAIMSGLVVTVVSAANLPNVEFTGKSDPYTIIEFTGLKRQTKVIESELNPKWDETLESFDLMGKPLTASDQLTILVKDYERIGSDRLLGQADFSLKDLLKGKNEMDVNLVLVDSSKRPNGATLNLKLKYIPPKGADNGRSGGGGQQTVSQNRNEDDDDDGDDDDGDQGGNADEEEIDTATGEKKKGGKKNKKIRGKRRIRNKFSNKPQDFQIRVKVMEARQLQGANISPLVRVTCWNQTKETRVQKSTNSPFWNEMFFFNFNAPPDELFDNVISFSVFNSKWVGTDPLIGSFKFDIGMIYDEVDHCFQNRWLLLSDPEDSMAGAKGYLKICAVVLGPGDEAPSFKPSEEGDDDIEANLLRPAGVQLRPATFALRLYRAEDLPKMDSDILSGLKKVFTGSEPKELCDPYVIFNFAGKEARSSTKYSQDHPEWGEELKMGLQFPSMCEKIKLQCFDWDRLTQDDAIGTYIIDISQISAHGEQGFLPTFGPCFINMYGSPREFSETGDEYEALNLGRGEGVAYRGRLLVELETILDEMPIEPVSMVNSDTLQRVQKFLRRRKYRLHAAFLSASMVNAKDTPVEFEVSIGNYGNKLDTSVPPCSSTTQPTNAIFDGLYYYFLPWGNHKPCTVIESSWEDISFRLFSINYFLRIADRLEEMINKAKIAVQANLPENDQAEFVIAALDDLILECNKPMPEWEAGHSPQNELDKKLEALRRNDIKELIKEVLTVRKDLTNVQTGLAHLDGFLTKLRNMAIEPQNSMPDVVIWMLCGDKRIAYYRIPAYDVLFAENEDFRGRFCGNVQTINLKALFSKLEDEPYQIPAQLRIKVWLGQEKEELEWHKMQTEGELQVVAETYENQVSFLKKWTTTGPLMARPAWSDSSGRVEILREAMKPPEGWKWDGDWYESPESSLFYDKDAGLSTFVEECYINETKTPVSGWEKSKTMPYTNVKGDACPSLEEMPCPDGWKWTDEWKVDFNRPCDEEGWEYTVEATMGGYVPVYKLYHMCRRRRFIRPRNLVDLKKAKQPEAKESANLTGDACWEYAPLFNMKFHSGERPTDLVRRKRWHRKMKPTKPGAPCFFNLSGAEKVDEKKADKSEKKLKKAKLAAPRMFLSFKKPFRWQLRVYMYQARDLLAMDQSGLSDPYCRVVFLNQSQVTHTVEKSLCPTWDQTLIFNRVDIHDSPYNVAKQPPEVVLELFDYDSLGEDEYIGRCQITPMVKLDPDDPRRPVLQWFPVKKGNNEGGEVLCAMELFLVETKPPPVTPPRHNEIYQVPDGIRPVMERVGLEILCWGVRNMKKYMLMSVNSPSIEFELGGHVLESDVIRNTDKNPNFTRTYLFMDANLPKEALYMPPMNIRVRDHRQFGRKPLVGIHVLKNWDQFRVLPLSHERNWIDEFPGLGGDNMAMLPRDSHIEIHPVNAPEAVFSKKVDLSQVDENIDWWSKYYASLGEDTKCKKYIEMKYDTIKIYRGPLETQETHHNFIDFCVTFPLYRGKNESGDSEGENIVGEFKGTFRLYKLPDDPSEEMPSSHLKTRIPDSSDPVECLVRVYIVQALDLQSNDSNGLADPYVQIKLGKKEVSNKDNYVPNTLSPAFGRMFELKCTIPIVKDLEVRILDYDLLSTDDVIGETFIDLENRLLSKYRATCGLPQSYCITGPNQWRDNQKPTEILDTFCEVNKLPKAEFDGNASLRLGNKTFLLSELERDLPPNPHLGPAQERLALHVLNQLPLVKEHVEKRPLFSPVQPGIEQGKLEMWVDIHPLALGEPGPPFDISVRQPKKYILRIIIWNTKDVILEEESITGEKMSDIYVKGWIAGIDERQETDVHYRSLDGEGNFNWRFVFPFMYLPAENTMVVKRKEHFWSLDETEQRKPCNLVIQIWDNDKFSADDFLGTLEMNLAHMPVPMKKSRQCDLKCLPIFGDPKMMNLFEVRRAMGYWPCYNDESGEPELTGKVEMELELLTEEDADKKPAGLGRDEPNENPHLEPPNRPDTSFLWFTSPWKTFKYIIWKNYKWYFICGLLIILFGLLAVLFIYSVPGLAARKIIL